ncbi:hypothetical protein LPJ59_003242 [Coemansia sp. RSA 2399]|nr:hypothetical protein LPJ59_003242 [Coemansia sp. RSA 2399]KAJ1897047.1 hypothetical protein LPJ81_004610 [Coemansia sp. IMI 209127]
MLPSIREMLAFGEARLNHEALRLPPPAFNGSEPGSLEAADTTSAIDERPSTPSDNCSKQRPGRKAGSHDRYTVLAGARQYKCGVHSCAALFKRPEHLKRHMLTHTQARPFQCEARGCGKRFSRRDNFLTHTKKHDADNSPSALSPGASVTASSDDEFLEDQLETDSPRGHKRTVSDMTSYAVVDSSSECGGSPVPRPVSSIFGLLNSTDNDDSSSSLSFALPPLELLAYASSAQSGGLGGGEGGGDLTMVASVATSLPQPKEKDDETLPPFPKKSRRRRASAEETHVVVGAMSVDASGSDPSKPFMCSKCDSRFGRLEHVKRHQLVHTGQRQFECPDCCKTFARKDNMIQHLRAHERKRGSAPATPL